MRKLSQFPQGFVLPLVIFAAVAVLFFGMFVLNMNSGYSNQISHMGEVTRCRAIGESAYSDVVARIRAKTWNERFFAGKPYVEEDVAFLEGSYDTVPTKFSGGHDPRTSDSQLTAQIDCTSESVSLFHASQPASKI